MLKSLRSTAYLVYRSMARASQEFRRAAAARREAEQARSALHEHEAGRHAFFETAPLLMGIVDLLPDDILHVSDNQTTATFFGTTVAALHNRSARELGVPDVIRTTWMHYYRECERTGQPMRFEYEHPTPCGPRWLAVIVGLIGASPAGHTRCSYVAEDVTERKNAMHKLDRSNALVRLLQTVAVASNQAQSMEEALVATLHEVCAYTGWALGNLYVVNEAGDLEATPLWHLDAADAERYAAFRAFSEQTRFAPGVGMPGRVLASGTAVWVADVTSDTNFPRAQVAADCGIASAFAFPILLQAEVVSVLEFFTPTRSEPDAALLELLTQVGRQLGRVVERQRAEDALMESERRFRTLATHAPVGIFQTDTRGDCVFVNQRWQALAGLSAEEARGSDWTRALHPDDQARVFEAWYAAAQHEREFAQEYRYQRPDGSISWLFGSAIALHSATGALTGYLGTVIDITERKRMEDELRQQRDLYESLLQALSDLGEGVAVAENTRFVFANEAYCKLTGYSYDELLALPSTLLVMAPGSVEIAAKAIEQANCGNMTGHLEAELQHKNGHITSVEFTSKATQLGGKLQRISVVRDASKRKRAEVLTIENERRFRGIFNSTFQFIALLEPAGTLLEVNQTALAFGGLTLDDVRGKRFWDCYWWLVSPTTQQRVRDAVQQAASGDLVRFDVEVQGADGIRVIIDFSIKPVLDDNGAVVLLIPEGRDVTAGKQAEAELIERSRLARLSGDVGVALTQNDELPTMLHHCAATLVQHLGAAFARIWTLDEASQVLELKASAGMYTHLDGAHSHVPVGSFKIGLIAEERRPHLTNNVASDPRIGDPAWAAREGLVAFAGYPLIVAGQLVGVMALFARQPLTSLVLDALGSVANGIALGIQRRYMENAIREQRDHYATLLQLLSDLGEGVTISTSQGLIFANDAVCRITGYSNQELLALQVGEVLIAPEDMPALSERSRRAALGEDVGAIECQLIHKQGHRVAIDATSKAYRQDDQMRSIAVIRDITERKRAQQVLRDFATRLEVSNRELQDFAYVASHDLQEPLRKIQAFGDRIKVKYATALEGEGNDYLSRMQNAASRMQALINDLLAFSRVSTKIEPFKPIDLAALAREVMSDLETRIAETGGRVELGALPMIEADPLQMRQLLQNLIGNALKFHRAGAPPVIRVAGHVGVTVERGVPSYQLLIEDNGIGFDEKYLDRIFTPFQRLHGRERYEGTGMGLAICRRIAERHLGSITATSAPGSGTTFIVTLPSMQPKGGHL